MDNLKTDIIKLNCSSLKTLKTKSTEASSDLPNTKEAFEAVEFTIAKLKSSSRNDTTFFFKVLDLIDSIADMTKNKNLHNVVVATKS